MTTPEQKKVEEPKGCRQTIGSIIVGVLLFVALIIGSLTGVDVVGILGLNTPTASGPTIFPTATPLTGTPEIPTAAPGLVVPIAVGQGFGAEKGLWQVYFTAPTGSRNPATYIDGIDTFLVRAIDNAGRSLDIAAFEWNLVSLTDAVLRARRARLCLALSRPLLGPVTGPPDHRQDRRGVAEGYPAVRRVRHRPV